MTERTVAWLIEANGPQWWAGRAHVPPNVVPEWTGDASKAVRFCRQQDAEQGMWALDVASGFMRATEHVFIGDANNARLIDAAPELLTALKRIVKDWDGEPEDMQEAREAISKATSAWNRRASHETRIAELEGALREVMDQETSYSNATVRRMVSIARLALARRALHTEGE